MHWSVVQVKLLTGFFPIRLARAVATHRLPCR